MQIAMVGMGRMGKAIKALIEGNSSHSLLEINNYKELLNSDLSSIDVAIDFTTPESAFDNLTYLIKQNIPVVCGTTGWLEKRSAIENLCQSKGGAFLYASNFSIGMNITFLIQKQLAKYCSGFSKFTASINETHHVHKLDAPSGTAKSLADDIIAYYPNIEKHITSHREGEVIGTHTTIFKSETESIHLKHEAHDRKVFAEGAIMAAEWLVGKKGIYSFQDILLNK